MEGLLSSTSDNIEYCADGLSHHDEDITFESTELYVQ